LPALKKSTLESFFPVTYEMIIKTKKYPKRSVKIKEEFM
jgi:hypothetical protein